MIVFRSSKLALTLAVLAYATASQAETGDLQRRARAVIRTALEGENGQLVSVALKYAPSLEEAWVGEAVLRAADHPSVPHRIAALDALTVLDREEAVRLFARALQDPDEHILIRMTAEEKLPQLDQRGASSELFRALLGDEEPAVRVLAAGALLQLGDRSGLAIIQSALRGDDLDLKVDAASELLDAGVDEAAALAGLRQALVPGPDPIPRSNAAYALGETRNPDAIPLLIEALKDGDRSVRLAAASSLALHADRMAPLLMEMAVTDPDYMIRLEAIHGLVSSSNERVTKALRTALRDPMASVRVAAASALGSHGEADPELADLVVKEIEGPDYNVRIAAITAMGQVGNADSASYLESRLSARDPMTRLTAAIAIDRILDRN